MYLVAFHAFLRVGEMTSDVANNDSHCFQYRDVVVDKHGSVINFQSYNSVPGTITKFVIKWQDGHKFPVYQLENYYRLTGNVMGPVYIRIYNYYIRLYFTVFLLARSNTRDIPYSNILIN